MRALGGRSASRRGRLQGLSNMGQISRRLYLCGGLEESGASLVSWCFWQRAEMRALIALAGDMLPGFQPAPDGRATWMMAALSSFRLSEMTHHYRDLGWDVHPLLVVRDLRAVWAALVQKPALHNGLTAEDPPLRVRFRRFVEDWELFRGRRWPMVRVEDLMSDAQRALRETCDRLELPWHDVMHRWPRPLAPLTDAALPDAGFHRLRGPNLPETLMNYAREPLPDAVAAADLEWLQTDFRQFNVENNYPPVLESLQIWGDLFPARIASAEETRRYGQTHRQPLGWLLHWLGMTPTPGGHPTRRAA